MEPTEKPDPAIMKSLSLGMVSDLSRLLAEKGFGERAIDIVEALVFAMFVVADTYSLAKTDQDRAIAVINSFYDEVQEYFIDRVVIRDHQVSDPEEIKAIAAKFHDLSRGRFTDYGERFKQDISDPIAMSCPATVSYFLDNIFIDPITKEEKLQLLGAVSDKVLNYWAGCVQSFK